MTSAPMYVVLIGRPTDPDQTSWLPTKLYYGPDRAEAAEIYRRLLDSGYPPERALFATAETVAESTR